jgi:hypothetical protein
MFALGLLALGGLRNDLKLGKMAYFALRRCGLCVRHSGMLLSDAGQFLSKMEQD